MASITPDSPLRNDGCEMTHERIAMIMTERGFPMCRGRVSQIEIKALRKIAADPVIRELASELGLLPESE